MTFLLGVVIFVAFWGVIGGLTYFFGDRQGDAHAQHLPPYRNEPRDE